MTANFTPHTNPYSGPDLALTYWTGVVVDVELLPALELVGGVTVVVGDLPVGAKVEALILTRSAPGGHCHSVAAGF